MGALLAAGASPTADDSDGVLSIHLAARAVQTGELPAPRATVEVAEAGDARVVSCDEAGKGACVDILAGQDPCAPPLEGSMVTMMRLEESSEGYLAQGEGTVGA